MKRQDISKHSTQKARIKASMNVFLVTSKVQNAVTTTNNVLSDELICLPSTQCSWIEAAVLSKSLLGDTLTTTEFWQLIPKLQMFISLRFESFDIGCQTESSFEVEISSAGKRKICNENRAELLTGLKSDRQMKIIFKFERKASHLLESFRARYMQQVRQEYDSELVSEESNGT